MVLLTVVLLPELALPLLIGVLDAQLEELLPLAVADGGVDALTGGRLGPEVCEAFPLGNVRALL